jgi:hypothetical protein
MTVRLRPLDSLSSPWPAERNRRKQAWNNAGGYLAVALKQAGVSHNVALSGNHIMTIFDALIWSWRRCLTQGGAHLAFLEGSWHSIFVTRA